MKKIFLFFLIFALCMMANCVTKQKRILYSGPELADNEIAILKVPSIYIINYVDGKQDNYTWPDAPVFYEFHFLPGPHTIEVGLSYSYPDGIWNHQVHSISNVVLKFKTEAGHMYKINHELVNKSNWNAWIEDITKGSSIKISDGNNIEQ